MPAATQVDSRDPDDASDHQEDRVTDHVIGQAEHADSWAMTRPVHGSNLDASLDLPAPGRHA